MKAGKCNTPDCKRARMVKGDTLYAHCATCHEAVVNRMIGGSR